ncbi:MAG: hypothetical protein WA973_05680 [Mesorhizobium sp.]
MMKFRVKEGYGQSTVREIGSYLRLHGSGHHWVEKFRGEIYVHPGDGPDERILLEEFQQLVEPVTGGDDD